MLSSIAGFIERRRTTIVTVLLTSTAAYVLGKYAHYKILELTEQAEKDRIIKENIRKRFEQNTKDIHLTILSFLPQLHAKLASRFDVDSITDALRESKSLSKDEKLKLWESVKHQSNIDAASSPLPLLVPGYSTASLSTPLSTMGVVAFTFLVIFMNLQFY